MNFRQFYKENRKNILTGASIVFGLWAVSSISGSMQNYKMNKICKRKGQQAKQAIIDYQKNHHQPCILGQELQNQILNSNIEQIQTILYQKKATVRQVLLVFIERVLKMACSDNLNLVAEINFQAALAEADKQDQEIANDPDVIKRFPLFGIPVSVKETFLMKDFDTTFGVGANCFKPSPEDGIQVAQIKLARGIIFVRSNIPQLAMTFESVNPVYGRSLNPWNKNRAVGGSSGGEGAFAAARCSVIGIGSDVGGSIRIPAAFCGVYGFKPFSGRIPDYGEAKISLALEGVMQLKISRGPIGRCVDDLIVFTRMLFDKQIYSQIPQQIKDPYFEPLPLGPLPNKPKLRIGYFEIFDGLVPPNCMRRGVREACEALRSKGHEIVEFQIDPKLQSIIANVFLKVVVADGGMRSYMDALKGQNFITEYDLLVQDSNTSLNVKKYLLGPLFKLLGQKTLLEFNYNSKVDVYHYLLDSAIRKQANMQFCQAVAEQGLDAILSPAFGLPAIKHGHSKELAFTALYTWLWNVVDFPAGSLPISVVQEGNDTIIEGKQNTIDLVYKFMQNDLKGSQGLPINVHVAALPNQDEMVLRVMKEIESVVNFHTKHPYPQ